MNKEAVTHLESKSLLCVGSNDFVMNVMHTAQSVLNNKWGCDQVIF